MHLAAASGQLSCCPVGLCKSTRRGGLNGNLARGPSYLKKGYCRASNEWQGGTRCSKSDFL